MGLFSTRLSDDAVMSDIQAGLRNQRNLGTLTAAARKIVNTQMTRRNASSTPASEAWEMRELVGELRFVTNTIAVKGSQAKFFVAKTPTNQEDDPVPLKGGRGLDAWNDFLYYTDMKELVKRALTCLQIAGEGYLAGIPGTKLGHETEVLEWFFLSNEEVKKDGDTGLDLTILGACIKTNTSETKLIQVWQPHPDDSKKADSPVFTALPILREIVGLTMHVSAQIDSRLAGAGILAIPQSATLAVEQDTDDESEVDPFTRSILRAAETAISNRSSAAALVPITITVPDEAVDKFKHLTFWTELDAEARPLREENIRRLAAALDAPAELLLGTAEMNHWGAWVSREETVQNNVQPLLDILIRAIVQEYLWPALQAIYGLTEEESREYTIAYSTAHMISRSNRTQDALNLHARGVISDEALRNTAGFDEKDAPVSMIEDPALKVVMDLVKASPSLAESPGIPILVQQITTLLNSDGTGDAGRSLTPPEENANPTGPQPDAEGLPPTTENATEEK